MRFTIILIFVMLLAAACHEKHDARLDGLEELMATAPDSALTILEELPESTLATDFDKARHAMLLMMAKDKCYLPLQPDSNLLWANEIFHRWKDIRNEMKSRYYAGLAYRHIGEYRDALWEALNAIDLSHEAADTFWMGRAHQLAFEIYSGTYDFHNAVIEADKAAIYYKIADAEPFHRYALLDKAYSLNATIDPYTKLPTEDGMPLLDSLISDARKIGDSDFLASCLLQKSSIFSQSNKNSLSQILLDSIFSITDDNFAFKQGIPIQAQNKLNIKENPLKEISEFEKLLESTEDTIILLSLKKQYACNHHNWEEATLLSDSLLQYAQNILGDKSFKSIDEIALSYNKAISERREKDLSTLHNKHRAILIGFILFILIVIGVSLWYRKHNLKKQKKIMAQILDLGYERDLLKQITLSQETVITENSKLKAELQKQESIKSEINRLRQELKSYENLMTEFEELQRKLSDQEKITQAQETVMSENSKLRAELQKQESIKSEINRLRQEIRSYENLMTEFEELQQKLKDQEKNTKDIQSSSINKSLERTDFIGTRIDAICDLAKDLEASNSNPALQKSLHNNLMNEVRQLRSNQYKKKITTKVNTLHNNILDRLKTQLPKVTAGDLTWLGMEIIGLRPSTICFLLDMEKSTFYSKRSRLATYIEKSDIPDKEEFLLFFPKKKNRE